MYPAKYPSFHIYGSNETNSRQKNNAMKCKHADKSRLKGL